MSDALYLYGLAPCAYHKTLEALPNCNVGLLKYAGLVAIYRQCQRREFEHSEADTDQHGLNRQLLLQIVQHDSVTQSVLAASPLFPVRFATLYSGEAALLNFMRLNHITIEAFLRSSEGYREWAVKGYVKREQAKNYRLAEELAQQPSAEESAGKRYVRERQMALKVERQLSQWLQTRAEQKIKQLSQFAADIIKRPLPASAQADEVGECFGNWAFLLADECVDAFKQTLHDINLQEAACGLQFSCTGPWALYSFCQQVAIKN